MIELRSAFFFIKKYCCFFSLVVTVILLATILQTLLPKKRPVFNATNYSVYCIDNVKYIETDGHLTAKYDRTGELELCELDEF